MQPISFMPIFFKCESFGAKNATPSEKSVFDSIAEMKSGSLLGSVTNGVYAAQGNQSKTRPTSRTINEPQPFGTNRSSSHDENHAFMPVPFMVGNE